MSDTVQMKALGEVRFGDPSSKKLKIVAPGTVFQCPADEADYFVEAGAAEVYETASPTPKTRATPKPRAAPKPKAKAKADAPEGDTDAKTARSAGGDGGPEGEQSENVL